MPAQPSPRPTFLTDRETASAVLSKWMRGLPLSRLEAAIVAVLQVRNLDEQLASAPHVGAV